MDDFQFIIESPQQKNAYKKRPRLVTSCDNCRVRKIKCLQSDPHTDSVSACGACRDGGLTCQFRDRERYFEERSRVITGSNTPPRSSSHAPESVTDPHHHRYRSSESNSSLTGFSVGSHSSDCPKPNLGGNAGMAPYSSSDPRRTQETHKRHGSLPNGNSFYPPVPNSAAYITNSPASQRHVSASNQSGLTNGRSSVALFDPVQPQFPNSHLMPQYIQLFYQENGNQFPFMSYEETLNRYFSKTLSPVVANCIAALAVRYSNVSEHTRVDPQTAAESYENAAKVILSSNYLVPSVDNVHALMLLSWIERKNHRDSGSQTYCQMAMTMGAELGLSNESALRMNPHDRDVHKLRSAWTSPQQPLQSMVSTSSH